MLFYILNESNEVVPLVGDRPLLAAWTYMEPRRSLAVNRVNGCIISTIFLVIDHNYSGAGPPVLFETMIFTKRKGTYKRLDQMQWRYSSYNEAMEAHHVIVWNIWHKNITYFVGCFHRVSQ